MLRKLIILLLFLPCFLYSGEKKIQVVVMDLFGQHIDEKDLIDLTNVLEKELVKTEKFDTISRSRIDEVLEEYGVEKKECTTVPWLVRIGKKLGVEKVVSGSVINRGTLITAHVRTVNVAKQQIDKSATIICKQCSIDDFYIRKMRRIARILAGLEKNEQVDDSLFTFNPGPLITLDKGKKDADISTKMGNKLFDGMWEMKSRKNSGVGIFLFGLGTSLLLIHNVLWVIDRPGTMERVGIASADAVIAFLSAPFFLRANRFGKGLPGIEVDSSYDKSIYKGFKFGIGITSFDPYSYESEDLYQSKAGIMVGGFFNFDLSDLIAVQTELFYVQKRIKLNGEYPDNEKLTLNYFETPLSLIGKLPLKGRFEPHIVFGVAPSFLIKAKESRININNEVCDIVNEEINRFDLGFNSGIEFEWKLKKGKLFFELRAEEGLIELGDCWDEPQKPKSRVFSFLLGYSF